MCKKRGYKAIKIYVWFVILLHLVSEQDEEREGKGDGDEHEDRQELEESEENVREHHNVYSKARNLLHEKHELEPR